MKLVPLSLQYKESFRQAMNEMRNAEEFGFWEEVGSPATIEKYIQVRCDHSEGKNLPKDWIPATTYWLVEKNEVIGEANIRHQLTDYLRTVGGQIGYWIRPSKRKKGYGKSILRLSLQRAKEIGMRKVLITCDETNVGSRKIIEVNGGIFERAQDMGKKHPRKLLFWIQIS